MSSKGGSSRLGSKDLKKMTSRTERELRDSGRVRGEVERVEKRLRATAKVKEQPPTGDYKRRALASPGETAAPTFLVDSRGIPRKTSSTAPRKATLRPASSSPRLASSSRPTESTLPSSSSRALQGASSSSSSRPRRLHESASGRGGSGGSAGELRQEKKRLPELEAAEAAPASCVVELRDVTARKGRTSPATPPETAGSSVCGQGSHARTAEKLEEGTASHRDGSRRGSVDAETWATPGDGSSSHEFESSPQREERMQPQETGRRELSSEPRSGDLTKNGGDGGPRRHSCAWRKWREHMIQSFDITTHPFPPRGDGSPRRGKFLMIFLTSSVLFFVFLQE